MSDNVENAAAAEELAALRAEVAPLRRALEAQPERRVRGLMEPDPEAPGLLAIWRGERGLAWQLFVQGIVTINAVLAVAGVVTIAAA